MIPLQGFVLNIYETALQANENLLFSLVSRFSSSSELQTTSL